MKILLLSYLFPPTIKGGAELSTYFIFKELASQGIKIILVTGKETKIQEKNWKILQPQNFYFSSKLHFLTEFFSPKRVANELLSNINFSDFDFIHGQDIYSLLVLKECKRNLRKLSSRLPIFVFSVRDYLSLCAIGNLLRKDLRFCSGCQLRNLPFCFTLNQKSKLLKVGGFIFPAVVEKRTEALKDMDALIFVSRSLQREFDRRILSLTDKQEVIPNPIPDDWNPPNEALKEKYSLLYVGRIENYKGVNLLLKAAHKLIPLFPQIKFYFVGEGRELVACKKKVKKWNVSDNIFFTGQIPFEKVKRFYEQSWVLVAPSLWAEPFGRIIIEGMFNRDIVIASDRGAFCELIQDRKNGFLFKTGNVEALHRKLIFVLRNWNNLGKMRDESFQYASKFNVDAIANNHIRFYEKLLR